MHKQSPMSAAIDPEAVRRAGLEVGFDVVRLTRAMLPPGTADNFREFVAAGHAGDMTWLSDNADRRADIGTLWPEARSAIVVALNYGPPTDPRDESAAELGNISVYARNRDYHDVMKGRLKSYARWLADRYGGDFRVFVDTAPILEKPLAQQAGLGWQGKHTNLVSRKFGSWLFLGEILTTLEIPPDPPEIDHCGDCRACLDICPTAAFIGPYRLDARRCVSYLTIEHKGHIPRDLRRGIGNRIYGCDACLAVCPWNKFARVATEPAVMPRAELTGPKLAALAALDDAQFLALFRGSPVKRTGRDRFVRNVLIAIGNSRDKSLAVCAIARLSDAATIVRAAAVWALAQILSPPDFAAIRADYRPRETDPAVAAEWTA